MSPNWAWRGLEKSELEKSENICKALVGQCWRVKNSKASILPNISWSNSPVESSRVKLEILVEERRLLKRSKVCTCIIIDVKTQDFSSRKLTPIFHAHLNLSCKNSKLPNIYFVIFGCRLRPNLTRIVVMRKYFVAQKPPPRSFELHLFTRQRRAQNIFLKIQCFFSKKGKFLSLLNSKVWRNLELYPRI